MTVSRSLKTSEARQLAVELLYNILEKGAFANLSLEKELAGSPLTSADKNLVTEIVNGTVRMLKHLDWVLDLFLNSDINKINPWLRTILRMTLYQILFMDKIPAYAAIDEAVSLTRHKTNKNLSRVTNGVLRNLIRKAAEITYPEAITEYLAVYYSHPEWIVTLLLDKFGSAVTEQILKYNNSPPGLMLRHNQLRGNRQELIKILQQQDINCLVSDRTPWAVAVKQLNIPLEKTDAFLQGCFYVQNEASMLAASILQAAPGQTVYDLCSGVGGKTTHMAEVMQNKGVIKAYELYDKKIKLLKKNCDRLGINIVDVNAQDVLAIDEGTRLADRVLLDAPCSGLGVLKRRSDMRWRRTPDSVLQLTRLQSDLLNKAGRLVDRGGLLLYATCTVNDSENENIVIQFLQQNPAYELESFDREIAYFALDDGDSRCAARGMLTIIPGKYETDGMFYALMRRKF
ncbi:MAG TPA: 16S rRNA (cytosine(967)-C(5))-methyltransferase RsmB [Syntrophomonadaceae bacterium]|nr:16S rRNA (cytosine(967)-C(5))-methyltransferase RsmB [Syntrophomonadaceae bacterium]HPR93765.1 16S rRNA (cytosine(967)-C(5))-methyltransferase RsmB [Syntrophomonadaceae bacterium]